MRYLEYINAAANVGGENMPPLQFAAVLLDYHMPELNGAQVAEKIRCVEGRFLSQTLIVGLTAETNQK